MAESLLENYNPLYDIHLRQYFALPHMQKHLRRMGLLDSNGVPVAQNGNVESELYARHHAMMDMMLRNRERILMQLAELQKKYDAAEKVEVYRRVRSGATNPVEVARNHLSRSLSRPRRAVTQPPKSGIDRRRHSSNSFEDSEVINRIEKTYEQPNQVVVNPKNTYDRLVANAFKYQFLHKLDDSTLSNYKESLAKQLQKLQRFRDISFGLHSVARHQPSLQISWFFRRRSLPSLVPPTNSQHHPLRSLKSIKNGTTNSAESHRRHGKSQSPRRHVSHQRRKSPQKIVLSAPQRLPPISTTSKPPSPPSAQSVKPVGIVAGVVATGAVVTTSVDAVSNVSQEKAPEESISPKPAASESIEASSSLLTQQQTESPLAESTPEPLHPAEEPMNTESDTEENNRDKRSVSFDHESAPHTDYEDHYDERQFEVGATESEASVPATPPGDHEVCSQMTQSVYQGVPEDFNEKKILLDSLNDQSSENHESEDEPLTLYGATSTSPSHDGIEERHSEVYISIDAGTPLEEQHFDEFHERPYSTEGKHENYDIPNSEQKHDDDHYDGSISSHQNENEEVLTAPDLPEGLPTDKEPSPEVESPVEDKSVPIVDDVNDQLRYSKHSPVIQITEAEPRVLTDDEDDHQIEVEHASEHESMNNFEEEHIEQVHHELAAALPDSEAPHHDDQSAHSEYVDVEHENEHEYQASPQAEPIQGNATGEHIEDFDVDSELYNNRSHHDAESHHDDESFPEHESHHDDAIFDHHSDHTENNVADSARSVLSINDDALEPQSEHSDAESHHESSHETPVAYSGTCVYRTDAVSDHHSELGYDKTTIVDSEPASVPSVTLSPHTVSEHHEDGTVSDNAYSLDLNEHNAANVEHCDNKSLDNVSASEDHNAKFVPHDDTTDYHSEHESNRSVSPFAESVHYDDVDSTHNKSVDTESVYSNFEVHSAQYEHSFEHDSLHSIHKNPNELTNFEHVTESPEVTTPHSDYPTVVQEAPYSNQDDTTGSVRHETYESTDDASAAIYKEDYTVDNEAIIVEHTSPVISEHEFQPLDSYSQEYRTASPTGSESVLAHEPSAVEPQKDVVDPMNQCIYTTSNDHLGKSDACDRFQKEPVKQTSARSIDSFEKHETELAQHQQHIMNYSELQNIDIVTPSDADDSNDAHNNILGISKPTSPGEHKGLSGELETFKEHHTEMVAITNEDGIKTATTKLTVTTPTSYQLMVIDHDNESDIDDEEHTHSIVNDNGHSTESEDSGSNAGSTSSIVHHETITDDSTTHHFIPSDDKLSETDAGQH